MLVSRYYLEFILNTQDVSRKTLHTSLIEYAEELEIIHFLPEDGGKGKNFKIQVHTQDPTVIFDICSQFGRLKSVKVTEEGGR
jgi:dihydroxyacetone kinase-like predicted kinase